MRLCICGFSCGTEDAFARHLGRVTEGDHGAADTPEAHENVGSRQHEASASTGAESNSTCLHTTACGCSKFQILGVSRLAETAEIRAAFKRQSLEWHPDRTLTEAWRAQHPGISTAQAAERFKNIRAAFEALLTLAERRESGGGQAIVAAQPLIAAAKKGDLAAVKRLLAELSGLEVGALDDDGLDALAWACRRGHREIVEALLAHTEVAMAPTGEVAVTSGMPRRQTPQISTRGPAALAHPAARPRG